MTASKFKIKWNRRAFEDLRHDPRIKAELKRRAGAIAREASRGGAVEGYEVTELDFEEPRGAVSVMATGHAHYHNRKNLALLKALERGKD